MPRIEPVGTQSGQIVSSTEPIRSVLLVTEDHRTVEQVTQVLRTTGCHVTQVTGSSLRSLSEHSETDVVLLYYQGPGDGSEEVLEALRHCSRSPTLVLMLSPGQEAFARLASDVGPTISIHKDENGEYFRLLPRLLQSLCGKGTPTDRMQEHCSTAAGEARTEIEQIIDAAAPMCVLDKQCRIRMANASFCSVFGINREEVVGKSCSDLWHDQPEMPTCLARTVIENGNRMEAHYEFQRADGHVGTFVVTVQPYHASDGSIAGAVATLTDISEQKAKQEELERYREHLELVVKVRTAELAAANTRLQQDLEQRKQAEARLREYAGQLENANRCLEQYSFMAQAASRAKSEFLSNVSHEMRTPLHGIIGISETILTSKNIEAAHQQAKVILDESEHLLGLINDLLDDAKIEQGKLELEARPFDLQRMLRSLERSEGLQAKHKGLEFRLEIGDDVPQFVVGDVLRLRQVILNLLGNAIKFTEDGWIRLEVSRVGTMDDKAALRFAVEDTGIGIPLEKQQSIFESFTQVDGSTTRKYGGSGLGISIARKLVHLMGGEVKLQSEPGKGSTFWFVIGLPVCPEPPKAEELATLPEDREEESAPEAASGKRILLVEDYPTNQAVVRSYLEGTGHGIDLAEDGLEAVHACRKQQYDLILMDLQMPVMDGYEATRQIRALSEHYRTVPILAMTADASKAARQACQMAGATDILTKPIRRNAFLSVLGRWLRQETPPQGDEAGQSSPTGEGPPAESQRVPETEAVVESESGPPLDYDEALSEFGGNRSLLHTVLKQFSDSLKSQVPVLKSAFEQSDAETVRREAHRIRGGAANLCAVLLSEIAARLEMAAESGNLPAAEPYVAEFQCECNRVQRFIESCLSGNGDSCHHTKGATYASAGSR